MSHIASRHPPPRRAMYPQYGGRYSRGVVPRPPRPTRSPAASSLGRNRHRDLPHTIASENTQALAAPRRIIGQAGVVHDAATARCRRTRCYQLRRVAGRTQHSVARPAPSQRARAVGGGRRCAAGRTSVKDHRVVMQHPQAQARTWWCCCSPPTAGRKANRSWLE